MWHHLAVTTPLVTVITPAYNIEDYLCEAADAVLAQTERDFEYLIVDDGSSDRTAEIAQSYADQDDRVRLLRLLGSGNGSSAARNAALREARGSYIAFCDGDDRWQPTFLQKSLATLQDAPDNIGATFCSCRYIDQHGRLWGKIQGAKPGDYDAERNLAGHCPQGNGSSLLLRKACFDEAGLFDEDLYNCVDLDMWLRINLKSSTPLFRYIDEPLVDWRVRPGAISASEANRVGGLDEIFKRYGHVLRPESMLAAYIWPATLAFYAGEGKLAKRWLSKVREADPMFFLKSKHGAVLGVFVLVGPRGGRALRSFTGSIVRTTRSARMNLRARRQVLPLAGRPAVGDRKSRRTSQRIGRSLR
jgi:glycosyltransferase involved in cell wall biosynthesis